MQAFVADHAKGSYIYTTDGGKHLDMAAGAALEAPHHCCKDTSSSLLLALCDLLPSQLRHLSDDRFMLQQLFWSPLRGGRQQRHALSLKGEGSSGVCATGIGVESTGHCHPKVVAAISEQAGKMIHTSQNLFTAHMPMVRMPLLLLFPSLQPDHTSLFDADTMLYGNFVATTSADQLSWK